MSRPGAVVLATLLVLTVLALPAVGASSTTLALGDEASAPRLDGTQQQFDNTEYHVRVYENGSARWTFVYKEMLENQTEVENFREYAARFENNSTDLSENFQRRATSLTAQAENVTGRQMAAEDFTKSARVERQLDNEIGEVRMSFRWTNFAEKRDGRVVVGDVFQDGLYIGADQLLVFEHGPNLRIVRAEPPGVNASDSVSYRGERQFTDEHPRVVYAPADGSGGPGPTSDSPSDPGGVPMMPVAALLVVLLAGAAAAFAYRSGALGLGGTSTRSTDGDGGAGSSVGGSPPAVAEEELLSDEDRVMQLLEENGGRMKQVNIVEETGWSKSKVSMLLSEMEEGGHISKLRIGRENVISVAGEEPDAAGSPFEDGEGEREGESTE